MKHCELNRKCELHTSDCGRRVFGAPVEPLFLPWREAFWQGLFRLGHLAWAPHLLFPRAAACSVKTVRVGWNFPLQGTRAWLCFSQRANHPVHQGVGVPSSVSTIAPPMPATVSKPSPRLSPSIFFVFVSPTCSSCGCLKKNQNAPRPSEHPPVRGKKCQNV